MAVDVTEYHLSGESPRQDLQGPQPQAAAPSLGWEGSVGWEGQPSSLGHTALGTAS